MWPTGWPSTVARRAADGGSPAAWRCASMASALGAGPPCTAAWPAARSPWRRTQRGKKSAYRSLPPVGRFHQNFTQLPAGGAPHGRVGGAFKCRAAHRTEKPSHLDAKGKGALEGRQLFHTCGALRYPSKRRAEHGQVSADIRCQSGTAGMWGASDRARCHMPWICSAGRCCSLWMALRISRPPVNAGTAHCRNAR